MCFALAARAGWPADRLRRLASGLADELSAVGRGAEAAAITLEYLSNVDSAGGLVTSCVCVCVWQRRGHGSCRRYSSPLALSRRFQPACLYGFQNIGTLSAQPQLHRRVPYTVLLLAHAKEWREALRVAYGNSR